MVHELLIARNIYARVCPREERCDSLSIHNTDTEVLP